MTGTTGEWSDTDLPAILADAGMVILVFDHRGNRVFHTDASAAVLSHINITLEKFLADGRCSVPYDEIDWEQGSVFYLRRPESGATWRCRGRRRTSDRAFLLVLEDVTLEYPDERVRQILYEQAEKALDGFGIADHDQKLLYINQGMRNMIGLSPDVPLLGHRVESFHPQGMGETSVEEGLRRSQQGGPYYLETVLASIDGERETRVSQMLVAHQDPLDDHVQYSTIVRDISESCRLREDLAEARSHLENLLAEQSRELARTSEQARYSLQLWRSLVDHNADLVLFTDKTGEILFANQGFLKGSGLTLVGENLFSFLGWEDRERVREEYGRLIAGNAQHLSIEAVMQLGREQPYFCVLLVNRVRQLDGEYAGTWMIADITSERKIRQQMALNEQMAATGRMAARVAHEINNPLAAIKSSMALVKMDLPEHGEAAEYIGLMESELERVSNIIRQMYGLYRPERFPARRMPLEGIIRECCTLLKTDARARGISLNCEFRGSVHAIVAESGLRQVLYNVILNAVDASPDDETVEITLHETENTALITVRDHGRGLTREDRKRIFEPFFTTKQTYSGMGLGLGLPVSLSLIRDMGGELTLEPAVGTGTECRIILPLA